MTEIYRNGPIELRLGRWQDVLADVEACGHAATCGLDDDCTCNPAHVSILTDPPYGERTAAGFKSTPDYGSATPIGDQAGIPYGSIDRRDADEIVGLASRIGARWLVVFGCHVMAREHEAAALASGRYVFAPLPYIRICAAPRFLSDGPQSSTDWIVVSRTRKGFGKNAWRSLRGWYSGKRGDTGVKGSKPIDLMRAIVRDYSMPGDIVVDPYAGGGTTLLAAAMEGRRCIGAECDPSTFAKAVRRLSAGWTTDLFGGAK